MGMMADDLRTEIIIPVAVVVVRGRSARDHQTIILREEKVETVYR
jgi:hypothetical protein